MNLKEYLYSDWKELLTEEFNKDYFLQLKAFLKSQRMKEIFPPKQEIFNAFNLAPFKKTKVVIIGQDPYHGDNQAHGLSFSVKKGVPLPPSLKNIYKELNDDLNVTTPNHGNLESWAKQGVLLLNSVLTVEKGMAASHRKKGWEIFTDRAIELLNLNKENLVFILWGSPAQKKCKFIDESRHLVLKSVHPSPLSADRGFLGSKPFSQTNLFLEQKGNRPIDWGKLP